MWQATTGFVLSGLYNPNEAKSTNEYSDKIPLSENTGLKIIIFSLACRKWRQICVWDLVGAIIRELFLRPVVDYFEKSYRLLPKNLIATGTFRC